VVHPGSGQRLDRADDELGGVGGVHLVPTVAGDGDPCGGRDRDDVCLVAGLVEVHHHDGVAASLPGNHGGAVVGTDQHVVEGLSASGAFCGRLVAPDPSRGRSMPRLMFAVTLRSGCSRA
jgi:hypothetical protein